MIRTGTVLVAAFITLASATGAFAQAGLAGQWTLDRDASQFPREIGFGINWATSGESSDSVGGGRRGGASGGGSTRNLAAPRESAEDSHRLRTLTDEVRKPPAQLTIAASSETVTITSDGGRTRTFHPNGRQEVLRLEGDVPLVTTTRWDGDRLVIVYEVEEGRQLRHTYSAAASPRQLVVDTQFLERGRGGDAVRRVYNESSVAPSAPAQVKPAGASPGAAAGAPSAVAPPPAAQAAAPKADLSPGAELRGLTTLGLVVEEPGSQATACGLTRDALDTAASKSLADAGLKIRRNTDEDTYLYVNVMAASAGGTCVSRYDVTLYTHTTATLPYTSGPVLVQVELLHKSGMAGGAPAANAQAVVRGVAEAVDQFGSRIREANQK